MVTRANNNPAITECPIPAFTGWCNYGYWLNGKLLNRVEYKKQFSAVNPIQRVTIQAEGKPFRSWRRQIIQKHSPRPYRKLPEAARGMDESQYHIPTLNDLGAL